MLDQVLELFKITSDYDLDIMKPGQDLFDVTSKVLLGMKRVLIDETPDIVLVHGDTTTAMATTLAAFYKQIPVGHVEAGLRTYNNFSPFPEEINRHIVDHVADINLTYSSIAREYLIKEGLSPETVIKTGSPMNEVLNYYKKGIENSDVLGRLGLIEKKFFLVSAHREENIDPDKNFLKLINILNKVAEHYNLPVIVSTHPRTKKRLDSSGVKLHENIQLLSPLGFKDYNKLQISAKAVLSDSGTINEESSILNFRALNIREAHERLEAMEEAAVMMVGLEKERVMQSLSILEGQSQGGKRLLNQVADYSMPNVSEKVVRIIHSYTDYVNRVVWKKY